MQLCPGISEATARHGEAIVRAELVGLRSPIAKTPWHPDRTAGRKSVPRETSAALYSDALTSMSTDELVRKHGLSRATIYRLMKRGPAG